MISLRTGRHPPGRAPRASFRFLHQLSAIKYQPTCDDRLSDPADQVAALKWSVAAFGMEIRGVHRPLRAGIHYHDIGWRTRSKVATRQVEGAGRTAGEQLDRALSAQHALVNELERQTERRLQPDDAVRRLIELHLLVQRTVRRVVGCDRVDSAVRQRLADGSDVVGMTKRRAHFR